MILLHNQQEIQVLGNNWDWRLTKNSVGDRILNRIRNLAVTYGR